MPKRTAIVLDHAWEPVGTTSKLIATAAPPLKKRKPCLLDRDVRIKEDDRLSVDEQRECAVDDRDREERDDSVGEDSVPHVAAVSAMSSRQPKGVILKSGRIRLPDKLMEYLNNEVTPSLYWQPDGQGFSINCDTVQFELLDKHFHGSKLSSFLRSLNRWGFKRLFYHSMPKNTLSFHNPLFRKDSPGMAKEMDMVPCTGGKSAVSKATTSNKVKKAPAPPAESQESCRITPEPTSGEVTAVRPVAAMAAPVPSQAVAAFVQPPQRPVNINLGGSNNNQLSILQSLIVEQQKARKVAAEKANEALILQALIAQHQRESIQQQQNAAVGQGVSATLELVKSLLMQQQQAPPPPPQPQPTLVISNVVNASMPTNQQTVALQALLPLLSSSQQLEILGVLQAVISQQNNRN